MSSGCILMQILPRIHFVVYVTILLQFTNNIMAKPYLEKTPKGLPGDFMNFVKNIGSVVYKNSDTNRNRISDNHKDHIRMYPDYEREEATLGSQKVALRDVLMMKLVSYYEDKYKVSRNQQNIDLEPLISTTTPTTTTTTVTENYTPIVEANTLKSNYEEIPEVIIL